MPRTWTRPRFSILEKFARPDSDLHRHTQRKNANMLASKHASFAHLLAAPGLPTACRDWTDREEDTVSIIFVVWDKMRLKNGFGFGDFFRRLNDRSGAIRRIAAIYTLRLRTNAASAHASCAKGRKVRITDLYACQTNFFDMRHRRKSGSNPQRRGRCPVVPTVRIRFLTAHHHRVAEKNA